MNFGDLVNESFLGKLKTIMSFMPENVLIVIAALLVLVVAIAIWRMIIGG